MNSSDSIGIYSLRFTDSNQTQQLTVPTAAGASRDTPAAFSRSPRQPTNQEARCIATGFSKINLEVITSTEHMRT